MLNTSKIITFISNTRLENYYWDTQSQEKWSDDCELDETITDLLSYG